MHRLFMPLPEATCVSKSHDNGSFSKHMWLLGGNETSNPGRQPLAASTPGTYLSARTPARP